MKLIVLATLGAVGFATATSAQQVSQADARFRTAYPTVPAATASAIARECTQLERGAAMKAGECGTKPPAEVATVFLEMKVKEAWVSDVTVEPM